MKKKGKKLQKGRIKKNLQKGRFEKIPQMTDEKERSTKIFRYVEARDDTRAEKKNDNPEKITREKKVTLKIENSKTQMIR